MGGPQHWDMRPPTSNTTEEVIHISDDETNSSSGALMHRRPNFFSHHHHHHQGYVRNVFGEPNGNTFTNYGTTAHRPPQPSGPSIDLSSKLEDKFLGFQPIMSPSEALHSILPHYNASRPPAPHLTDSRTNPSHYNNVHNAVPSTQYRPTHAHEYPAPSYNSMRSIPTRGTEYPPYNVPPQDVYRPPHQSTMEFSDLQARQKIQRQETNGYTYDNYQSYTSHYNNQRSFPEESPVNMRSGYQQSSYTHNPFGSYPHIPAPPGDLLDELRNVSNPPMRGHMTQHSYSSHVHTDPRQMMDNKKNSRVQVSPIANKSMSLNAVDMIPGMTDRGRRQKKANETGGAESPALIPAKKAPQQKKASNPGRKPRMTKKAENNTTDPSQAQPSTVNGVTQNAQAKIGRRGKNGASNVNKIVKPPTPRNQRRTTLRNRGEQQKKNGYDEKSNDDVKEHSGDERSDTIYDSDVSTSSSDSVLTSNTVPVITKHSDNFCFASNAIHVLSETVDMVRQFNDYIASEVRERNHKFEGIAQTKVEQAKPEPTNEQGEKKPASEESPTCVDDPIIDLSIYNCVMFNEKHRQKKAEKLNNKKNGSTPDNMKRKATRRSKPKKGNRLPARTSSGIRKSKLKKGPGLDVYEVLCATRLSKISDQDMEKDLLTQESIEILEEARTKQRKNTETLLLQNKENGLLPDYVPSVHYFLSKGNDVHIGTNMEMIAKRDSPEYGVMLQQLQDQLQDDGMGNRFGNMGDYIQQNISLRTRGLIYRLNTQRVASEVLTLKRKDIIADLKSIVGISATTNTTPSSVKKEGSQNGSNSSPPNSTNSRRIMDDMFDYEDIYKRNKSRRRMDNTLVDEAPLVSPKRSSTRVRKEKRSDDMDSPNSSIGENGDEEANCNGIDTGDDGNDDSDPSYNLRKRKANARRSARVQKRQKVDNEKTVARKRVDVMEPDQPVEDSNDSTESGSQPEAREEPDEEESQREETPVKPEEQSNISTPTDVETSSTTEAELLAARAYNTRSSERRLMTQLKQLDDINANDPPTQPPATPNRRKRINRDLNRVRENAKNQATINEENSTLANNTPTIGSESIEHSTSVPTAVAL
jgi:hypothetical protein